MDLPEELRARAAHCQELAEQITDAQARAGIIELARHYEEHAARIVSRERDADAGDAAAG